MNSLHRAYWIARGVGWENFPRRLLQALRVKSGYLQRALDPARFGKEAFAASCLPSAKSQRERWAQRAERFFTAPAASEIESVVSEESWRGRVTEICEQAMAGEHLFFGRWYGELGWPPKFDLDPVHKIHWPTGKHWIGTDHSGPPYDDIKLVWEASRFSLAYYFGRAYQRDKNEKWARGFWQMFGAWVEQNPPELTVAWVCGQEMTFRLMAMLFGAMMTRESGEANEERLGLLAKLAWQTAKHIHININGARMQGNNHAFSEAIGLWTVGAMFPEFAEAGAWRREGLRVLAAECKRQIYDDGSYVQNSLNYHRVMMDDLLWFLTLANRCGEVVPQAISEGFARATDWLAEMMDKASGGVPNYGANDGAEVLPLATCGYGDYRPALQAAWFLVHQERKFERGPWDEKLLWLFGGAALETEQSKAAGKHQWQAPSGGYYILRGERSWAMTRCHTFRHRPSQADMLHLDLWYNGKNLLCDGGSYLYYCAEPAWQYYFLSTAAHNTVEVDARSQMVKGPRFLWFRWTRARLLDLRTSADGRVGWLQGEHYAYADLPGKVVHRRSVCRIDDTYIVVDDVLGSQSHEVALRWRLGEADWKLSASAASGSFGDTELHVAVHGPAAAKIELVRGRQAPCPEGWQARYYGVKEPAATMVIGGKLELPARFVTVVGRAERMPKVRESDLKVGSPVHLDVPEELAASLSQVTKGKILA